MKRFPVPVHGNIRSLLAVTSGWRGSKGGGGGGGRVPGYDETMLAMPMGCERRLTIFYL